MTNKQIKPEHLAMYNLYPCGMRYLVEEEPYCSTFLEFAREDLLASQDMRSIGNAVSNSKKALHRRVERLCEILGYKLHFKDKNNFPSKLDYLNKCGIISPRILYRLNSIRNKIEHEYVTISYEEAEDFVDIIELFLVATGLFLKSYPETIEGSVTIDEYTSTNHDINSLPKNIEFELKLDIGEFVLRICESNGQIIKINYSDDSYLTWLNFLFSQYFRTY